MLIGPFWQSKLLFVTVLQVFFQKNFSAISLQNWSGSLILREYISLYCSIDLRINLNLHVSTCFLSLVMQYNLLQISDFNFTIRKSNLTCAVLDSLIGVTPVNCWLTKQSSNPSMRRKLNPDMIRLDINII
jgi:hypothetical protein